jgi:hypothetical protein
MQAHSFLMAWFPTCSRGSRCTAGDESFVTDSAFRALTSIAFPDEELCHLAAAGRFAVRIEAYCVNTELVLLLVVASCTLARPSDARPSRRGQSSTCPCWLRHLSASYHRALRSWVRSTSHPRQDRQFQFKNEYKPNPAAAQQQRKTLVDLCIVASGGLL